MTYPTSVSEIAPNLYLGGNESHETLRGRGVFPEKVIDCQGVLGAKGTRLVRVDNWEGLAVGRQRQWKRGPFGPFYPNGKQRAAGRQRQWTLPKLAEMVSKACRAALCISRAEQTHARTNEISLSQPLCCERLKIEQMVPFSYEPNGLRTRPWSRTICQLLVDHGGVDAKTR